VDVSHKLSLSAEAIEGIIDRRVVHAVDRSDSPSWGVRSDFLPARVGQALTSG
jgi:hypothetical protein